VAEDKIIISKAFVTGVKTLAGGVGRATIDLYEMRDVLLLMALTEHNIVLTIEPMATEKPLKMKRKAGGILEKA
jgi:hypothetical protein